MRLPRCSAILFFLCWGNSFDYCLTTIWNFSGGEQSSALVHLVTLSCTWDIACVYYWDFDPKWQIICASNASLIALILQIEPCDFRIQLKQLRYLSGIVWFVRSSFSLSLSPSEWWYMVQFFLSFVRCWRSNRIQVRGQAGGEEVGHKLEHLMENKHY